MRLHEFHAHDAARYRVRVGSGAMKGDIEPASNGVLRVVDETPLSLTIEAEHAGSRAYWITGPFTVTVLDGGPITVSELDPETHGVIESYGTITRGESTRVTAFL